MPNQAENTEVLYTEIPKSLKWQVDEHEKTNKDVVIEALEDYFGVSSAESEAVIKRQMKREKDEIEETKEEVENLQRELQRREKRLADMQNVLEQQEENKQEYRAALLDRLDKIEAGETPHVWLTARSVTKLADEYGKSADSVMYDLKRLAAKREYDIYNINFMKAPDAEQVRMNNNVKPISEVFNA